MEERSDWGGFLRALAAEWFTAMSGALGVPLTVGAFFVEATWARVALGVTAATCFIYAGYKVWSQERKKVMILNDEIRKLKANVEFNLSIGGLNIFDNFHVDNLIGLMVSATIESLMSASVAKNWKLTVQVSGEQAQSCSPMHIGSDYTWTNLKTQRKQTILFANYLPYKTENIPVQGGVHGDLLFFVGHLKYADVVKNDTTFTLSVVDKNNKEHAMTTTVEKIRSSFPVSYDSKNDKISY